MFTKEVAQNFHNIEVCSQQTLNLLSAAKIRGNNAFGRLLFIIDSLITVANQLGLGKQCLPATVQYLYTTLEGKAGHSCISQDNTQI